MKVLWLRPSKGDNISVRRERIASELRKKGYEIDICDTSGLDAVNAVKQAVTGEYDVIAGNVRIGLYLGYPIARLLGIPFLGDVSDPISDITYLPDPLFRFFEWYEWFVLGRADSTVFVYRSSYEKARNRGITTARRLPNAVSYEAFSEPDESVIAEAEEILASAGVDMDRPIAIYLGVFSRNYCIKEILDAATVATDWEFVLIGEGELEQHVASAAKSKENIYFLGTFPYRIMPGFLSHADAGFCFKDAEQPLKLKEYGAAGIPTVARPGNLSQWYDDDQLLFVEPNKQAIADGLKMLQTNEELYNRLSEAGREIGREWSWKEIAKEYDTAFREIVE